MVEAAVGIAFTAIVANPYAAMAITGGLVFAIGYGIGKRFVPLPNNNIKYLLFGMGYKDPATYKPKLSDFTWGDAVNHPIDFLSAVGNSMAGWFKHDPTKPQTSLKDYAAKGRPNKRPDTSPESIAARQKSNAQKAARDTAAGQRKADILAGKIPVQNMTETEILSNPATTPEAKSAQDKIMDKVRNQHSTKESEANIQKAGDQLAALRTGSQPVYNNPAPPVPNYQEPYQVEFQRKWAMYQAGTYVTPNPQSAVDRALADAIRDDQRQKAFIAKRS